MKGKHIFAIVGLIFLAFVFVDSMGVFDSKDYYEVPHGNHTHYVAKDRDKTVSIGQFPTRPPRETERISPIGEFVPR